MTYIANAPPGTYDHRALECKPCKISQARFYKPYKSAEPWRCCVCGEPEGMMAEIAAMVGAMGNREKPGSYAQGWKDCAAHALSSISEAVPNLELRTPLEVRDMLIARVKNVVGSG